MKTLTCCVISCVFGIVGCKFFDFLFPEESVCVCSYDQQNIECERVISSALKSCPESYRINNAGVAGVFMRPNQIIAFLAALSDQGLVIKSNDPEIYFTEFRPGVIPDAAQSEVAQPSLANRSSKRSNYAP
jgi:hypothetical protein